MQVERRCQFDLSDLYVLDGEGGCRDNERQEGQEDDSVGQHLLAFRIGLPVDPFLNGIHPVQFSGEPFPAELGQYLADRFLTYLVSRYINKLV